MKKAIAMVLLFALLLAGCGAGGAEETLSDEQILEERRNIAESHMRFMMSAVWEPDADICYSKKHDSQGPENDDPDSVFYLKAGELYAGMPYAHGSGGAASFFSYGVQDENGIYKMQGLTGELLSGTCDVKPNNMARLSNDCADAVYWSWARIGTSYTFSLTKQMTKAYGCLPVGDYITEENKTYAGTKELLALNGEETMYEAYAQLQKADAVVTFNVSGHAMMAVSVNTVRQEGKIDPAESYVTVHEQFSGNYREGVTYIDEKTGRTVHQLGGVDRKYTFLELFEKGYVPVTIQELRDPAPAENVDVVDSAKEFTVDTITAGSFSSLAKIDMVTIVITDEAGNVVQEATAYAKEETHLMFRLEIFEDPQEAPVIRGGLDLDALSPGKYHCKTDCYIGSGDVVTVRDFDFTVE